MTQHFYLFPKRRFGVNAKLCLLLLILKIRQKVLCYCSLEDPCPEGHVDVEHVSSLPLPDYVRVEEAVRAVGVLDDVVERQWVQEDFRNALKILFYAYIKIGFNGQH